MTEQEYQTVILAALLHDVGKVLQRISPKLKGGHPQIAADLFFGEGQFSPDGKFSKWNNISRLLKDEWIDKDILKKALKYHHKGSGTAGWIVHKADSYSTKERLQEDERMTTYPPGGPTVPLRSIFNKIKLDEPISKKTYAYKATELNSLSSFPIEEEKLDRDDIADLAGSMFDEIASIIFTHPDFDRFYNTLYAILEKYLWCLPCHTHPEIADVSLFDHLKSTSAIAACLYIFHQENDSLRIDEIKKDDDKKFLLVGGDLSGIQNYLYQISSITGEGGVAKRLRARSFYLSTLMEVVVLKILQELGLPISCNLTSTGGKFIILAPNTKKTKEKLEELSKYLSRWFLEEFSGELSLSLVWNVELNGDDFYRKEEREDSLPRECNYRNRLIELMDSLEEAKQRKFYNILKINDGWDRPKFIREKMYEAYKDGKKGDCHSCRRFPEELPDPDEERHWNKKQEAPELVFCKRCYQDKLIGRDLIDAEYIAIGKDNKEDERNTLKRDERKILFFDGYYAIPLSQIDSQDYLLIQRIREREDDKLPATSGFTFRFLANYVPSFAKFNKDEPLCKICKEKGCEHQEYMSKEPDKKHLYTFNCIAAESSIPDSDKYKGDQLLGVLKADVDNLGLIFSEGLENRLTISRYLTISRMIDLFFSGWMWRILEENKEFSKIYTVYSGGDDLVLVGPWEAIIKFSECLHREFERFTCHNPNITLSAGIAIVKPKCPISKAASLASELLERSKKEGKDRLTLFGTTIKWNLFDELKDFACFLDTQLNINKRFSAAFLYRLLKYHLLFLEYQEKGEINGLMYHSLMAYDVGRKIVEWKNGEIKKEDREVYKELLRLYQVGKVDVELMENLKIPLFWTLYKNRGGKIS